MGILEGRSAIIVGASSGVGYGTALKYAEEGAVVIASARRLSKLEELRDDVKRRGFSGEIVPVQCDIANEEDLDKVVAACIDKCQKIDILACIAQGGLNDQRAFEQTDKENALEFFIGGPVYTMQMIQKCLPYMKEKHYGRILTCASGAGERYTPNTTAYGMAKAAIINLTRTCAVELGKYGIVTNCFNPVATNDYFEKQEGGAAIPVDLMNVMSPVGRLGGAYKDCSPILVFLASEEAGYINGQIIDVCGGISYTSPAQVMTYFASMAKKQN